jgi:neutral ceramidase
MITSHFVRAAVTRVCLALCLVAGTSIAGAQDKPAAAKPESTAKPDGAAKVFQAGAATANITPEIGLPIVGGFSPTPSTHIHDELHARCFVVDDGERRVALVVCDLLGAHRSVSDEARRLITAKTGIPKENVLISCTHTHSASSALGDRTKIVDQKPDDYQLFVAKRIADGVVRAVNTLRPAELAYGTVAAPEHVFNRRWFMRPGTMPENPFGTSDLVKMNPGSGPNLVEPAGPVDPTVHFLALREPDGKSIGLIATYSLHYVGDVGPNHISADYFGYFAERMKRLLTPEPQDPPFVAAMANGTSGDINNNNLVKPQPARPRYGRMEYVAHDVAAKVHGELAKVKYRRDVTVDARYREPMIASRVVTPELMEWANKKVAEPAQELKDARGRPRADLSRIYAERTLRLAQAPKELALPVQVLRIGDVCIGTLPCETFVEIGMEFKERSPIKQAFMISLNHGYYGYLPTPRQHELGGYETWPGTNRLEKEASVKFLNQLVEMAAELNSPPAPPQKPADTSAKPSAAAKN